jgi:hypothetical protein
MTPVTLVAVVTTPAGDRCGGSMSAYDDGLGGRMVLEM